MCHVGTKSAGQFIPSTPLGTHSERAASSLLSRLGKKRQERWEEAVNAINFCTTAARGGAPSTNLLSVRGTPPVCARLRKLHHFTTGEERDTRDEGPRVHKAHQQVSDL